MRKAENRDFDRFYGITGATNHFTSQTADRCNSTIFFRPALPQMVLKFDNSASSFLTLAKYGTGKTELRCKCAQSSKFGSLSDYLYIQQRNQWISRSICSRNEST